MNTPYYRPSGRVPASAYLCALLIAPGLIPFAWMYAWLVIHAPPVFNFFIAFCFSFAIGELTKRVAARGKVRSAAWIGRAGIVFGVLGWYLQWAAWSALTIGALRQQELGISVAGTFVSLATQPWLLVRFAMDIAGTGTMSFFGWPLKGAWLAGVWLIELWMLLMVAPTSGRMRAGEPFCEATNTWAGKIPIPGRFRPVDAQRTASWLEAEPQALRVLLKPMAAAAAASHAEVILWRCTGPDAYVSITNVHVAVDKKGQMENKRESVVEYLRLPDADADALIACLGAQPQSDAGRASGIDAVAPIVPELCAALEHLEEERYPESMDAAAAHVSSDDGPLRRDARRICALACSRLGRWQDAVRYFGLLFDEEPTAHNALQLASSSVMAGTLAQGLQWMDKALALNAVLRELPHMTLLTGFVTALKQAGHAAEAMPFIDQIRQAYTEVGSTDPTVLHLRSMPFFSAFLSNSLHFVRASLEPEQGRHWYAHMLPSLDAAGRAELSEWLENEFGPAAGQA